MNLWDKLKERFGKREAPPAGPVLRNKPGGLAWIRDIEELRGRVVTTVLADTRGFWKVDPPQHFEVASWARTVRGELVPPGTPCTSVGIADACLEPIPPVGDEERDESAAWLPPVPMGSKATA